MHYCKDLNIPAHQPPFKAPCFSTNNYVLFRAATICHS
jgi:hypothetical protein